MRWSRSAPPPMNPAIDPRIAARRARVEAEEVQADTRLRRRRGLCMIVVLGVLSAGSLLLLSPVASVRTVEVIGARRTSAVAVEVASGLADGRSMLRLDASGVRARVRNLPWVSRVKLERRWPATVVLTVSEREPAAIYPCRAGGATECLVDRTGRVLAPVTDAASPVALPRLSGVPAAGEPGSEVAEGGRGVLAVASALPVALRPLVLSVRGDGNEVALDLSAPGREHSPPVVRLGSAERIADKLTAAATVLARTSVNGVAVLDVRIPESPALTRVRR